MEALDASTAALALSSLFQVFSVRMIATSKVLIGQYKGANRLDEMGSCIWQMIWLSFFLFLLAIPLSFFLEHFFFQNTSVSSLGIPYFRLLIPLNLLLPLGTALSAFYAGQGKTKIALYAGIFGQGINLLFGPLLIFGVKGFFPSFGIQGAAISTLLGQCVFCGILLFLFLKKKTRIIFGTHHWQPKKTLLVEFLKLGIPRALARAVPLLVWIAAVRLITQKGGDYLLVLSFSTTIHLFFIFVVEGMGQALLIIGSYIVGLRQLALLDKLIKTTVLFIFLGGIVLAIPFLVYPELIIKWIMPNLHDFESKQFLRYTCYWTYCTYLALSINSIGHNLLTVLRNTFFQMVYQTTCSWFLVYGGIFIAVEIWQVPDKTGFTMLMAHLTGAFIYFTRLRTVAKKQGSNN
jgi:MATE family multidrug resistance protein